jgi:hypothetical protein
MDIAKSLFGNRPHEGYGGKEDYNVSSEVGKAADVFDAVVYFSLMYVIVLVCSHHVAECSSCVKTPCCCISKYLTVFSYTLLLSHLFLKLHYNFYFLVINVVFRIRSFEFYFILFIYVHNP